MKTKFVAATVIALATLGSASAFAQSQNHQYGEAALVAAPAASSSSLTRAQVRSAYLQARQNGEVATSNEGAFASASGAQSPVSRQAVRSEAAVWARSHQAEGLSAS